MDAAAISDDSFVGRCVQLGPVDVRHHGQRDPVVSSAVATVQVPLELGVGNDSADFAVSGHTAVQIVDDGFLLGLARHVHTVGGVYLAKGRPVVIKDATLIASCLGIDVPENNKWWETLQKIKYIYLFDAISIL